MTANRPHLVAFGFPVYFRISFFIGAAIAILIFREFGIIIALGVGGSILIHELGHSFAFRRYGTESHIVVHVFGGYSSPDNPRQLSHRQWVIVSLAGPVTAFLLLGAPAWLFQQYGSLSGYYTFSITQVLIYFNIYWGAINLMPLWPLDGGRVLYHGTNGNWEVTKTATLGMSGIALVLAYKLGFTFGAIFVIYNAYQVFNSSGPNTIGLPQNRRLAGATEAAKSYATTPTKTRGSAGTVALESVYYEIVRDRHDRADEPLTALLESRRHRRRAVVAQDWSELLSSDIAPSSSDSPLLTAVASNDLEAAAAAFDDPDVALEAACALRVLHRRGHLEDVCARLAARDDSMATLRRLERLTLDHGLVGEQQRLTAALGQ